MHGSPAFRRTTLVPCRAAAINSGLIPPANMPPRAVMPEEKPLGRGPHMLHAAGLTRYS